MNVQISTHRIADHPVDPQFLTRWSPRAFSEAAMSKADVEVILEAARWAPSSNNLQPWRFVWGLRGEVGFASIAAALVPGNRVWAERGAALVVIASRSTTLRDGVEMPNGAHGFDTGTAWGHLALQAHLSGFVAHAMGGFDHAALGEAIKLPEHHTLHAVVALGRLGDPASLPEALRSREVPNSRKPLDETTFRGTF